ncbi:lysophospholipid acyltransferase family protein [Nocardioides alkalitolerans]|uniref:lysophospholipid acyltransferase family protein n=1 Tax=Nocardioides alkalitolerans TaxID=281714 RepID=UPI0003FD8B09|nr:lysophospholipid acyltransferase family protein [Nocardioides alkalitolerans]
MTRTPLRGLAPLLTARTGSRPHQQLPASDGVRRPHRWLLHGGRPASRWLIRRRFAVRLHHPEHVPRRGGVVLAANHIGWGDGPVLAIFSPRPVHALTKVEMFAGPLGAFLRTCGQIPLDRFAVDVTAVRTCLRVLRDGGVVGVFPEGRRGGGDLSRFHRGAAYLALTTGAPVVPVVVIGTREPGQRSGELPRRGGCVDLYYGEPLRLTQQPWPRTREQVEQASLLLRRHMLATIDTARAATGRDLPGPLAPDDLEDDPYTGLVHLDPGAP